MAFTFSLLRSLVKGREKRFTRMIVEACANFPWCDKRLY